MLLEFPDLKKFVTNVRHLCSEGDYFSPDKIIFVNRTPGRLDLMGGNDDYTGGLVFEATIREATFVAIQPREDDRVYFFNPAVKAFGWQDLIEFSLADLLKGNAIKPLKEVRDWINNNPKRNWCSYVLGDLYYLLMKYPDKIKHGFNLYLESDVPIGKGVSSSAALEVAAMKAMAHMYGIEVHGIQLALWTQWVEIALTNSACGIMDQLTVTMGDVDGFLPILCQPCQPYPLVHLPTNLRIWGIDSGVQHTISGIEYEVARAATFMGYRYLCDWEKLDAILDESGALPCWRDAKWDGYLANLTPSIFRAQYEPRLPEAEMGSDFLSRYPIHFDPFTPVRPKVIYPVRAATRYAVEENWRVHCFFTLMSSANTASDDCAELLGELMYLSHVGYSECRLGTEATDHIVSLVRTEKSKGLIGAKITGGGAGGTVAILGFDTPQAENAFQRVLNRYADWSNTDPYVFEGSSKGSDKFGVLELKF
jgi:L-arabinokinase